MISESGLKAVIRIRMMGRRKSSAPSTTASPPGDALRGEVGASVGQGDRWAMSALPHQAELYNGENGDQQKEDPTHRAA